MIVHVDMDAFYAAVEQRDDPSLRGKPVIVGGSATGRGVVSAASYEAREFGVHSAMPTVTAQRLCPNGIFLPTRMGHYANISGQIRDVFCRYTPLVEPLSLDEAFLDVAGSERLFGSAVEIGERVKSDIRRELDLVASVGVAPNKFLAKLASDLEKPDGFVVVDPNHVQAFLDPLSIGRLWGVGKVTGASFERMGVRNIAQLRALSADFLRAEFGDSGVHLWNLAHGIDDRSVVPDRAAKSISHETTMAVDVDDEEVIRAWLLELADQVGRRLRRNTLTGRTVQLKVRFGDFQTITRSKKLMNSTDVTQEIFDAVLELYQQRVRDRPSVRLIGVGVTGLESSPVRQKLLFDETAHEVNEQADRATDAIRRKFGQKAMSRGSRLLHQTNHHALPRVTDRPAKPEREEDPI